MRFTKIALRRAKKSLEQAKQAYEAEGCGSLAGTIVGAIYAVETLLEWEDSPEGRLCPRTVLEDEAREREEK